MLQILFWAYSACALNTCGTAAHAAAAVMPNGHQAFIRREMMDEQPLIGSWGTDAEIDSNTPNHEDHLDTKLEADTEETDLLERMGSLLAGKDLAIVDSVLQNEREGSGKVAMCLTGHVRTLVLPGVHRALASNSGNADLFIVAHMGNKGHPAGKVLPEMAALVSESAVSEALNYLGMRVKYVEVHPESGCEFLREAWVKDGIANRTCDTEPADPNFLQIMWIDHCFRQVLKSEQKYELLVRSRPDVGLFLPVQWSHVSRQLVQYMQKDWHGRADWFFTMPRALVKEYWHEIMYLYLPKYRHAPNPDYAIFNYAATPCLQETAFPAVIVRGRHKAECWRMFGKARRFRDSCEKAVSSGYFALTDLGQKEPTEKPEARSTTELLATNLTNLTLGEQVLMHSLQEPAPRWRAVAAFALAGGILGFSFQKGASSALALSCMLSVVYIVVSVSIDLIISSQKHIKDEGNGEYDFNPLCAVILTELVKLVISLLMYTPIIARDVSAHYHGLDVVGADKGFSFADMVWLLVPGLFMTVNNVLVFKAIGSNDAAAFGVFRDTVIIWTAGLWRFAFHVALGWVRMSGIAIVFAGLLLNRLSQEFEGHVWSWTFLWVILMTVMNATGSVANEFALKRSPALDINLQNAVLYFACVIFGTFVLLLDQPGRLAGWRSFFQGFEQLTFIMISCQAGAGLLVSRLLKYTDAVTKTMATCLRGPVLVLLAPYFVKSPQSVPVIASAFIVASGAFIYLSQGPLSVAKKEDPQSASSK